MAILKRIGGWLGRRVGWGVRTTWEIIRSILKALGILILIIIAALLTFMGQLTLLILGGIVAVCLILLKGFAWITYHLMVSAKWLGSHVQDFTETFYDGVMDVFTQEEEFLNREVTLLISVEKD
jgi:hypothetical protein